MTIDGKMLDYQILSRLCVSDTPVGALALHMELGRRLGIGQATIGRRLAEMDRAGLTQIVGNKGRVVSCEWSLTQHHPLPGLDVVRSFDVVRLRSC